MAIYRLPGHLIIAIAGGFFLGGGGVQGHISWKSFHFRHLPGIDIPCHFQHLKINY